MDQANILAKIEELYDECLVKSGSFHRKIDLFIAPDEMVAKVLIETGLDITGHMISLDNYGIVHTLEQHGNPISEARRGQIAIVKDDFFQLIEVLLDPDLILSVGQTKRTNLPLIQFVKKLEDKVVIVKEVRTITGKKQKVSRLILHTMYKIKAPK